MASLLTAKSKRAHPRAVFRLVLIFVTLGAILPLHGLWRLFGARSPWPTFFLKVAGRLAGAKVTVKGTPVKQNVLYIANHISWLDILVLAGETGSAFVAMADMIDWPVLGWLAELNNSVYVQRENRLDVGAQRDAINSPCLRASRSRSFLRAQPPTGESCCRFDPHFWQPSHHLRRELQCSPLPLIMAQQHPALLGLRIVPSAKTP